MPIARIERLSIDAGEMAPADARRLILLVAAGMADAEFPAGRLPSLTVAVEAGGGIDELAKRIVAGALSQIWRAP